MFPCKRATGPIGERGRAQEAHTWVVKQVCLELLTAHFKHFHTLCPQEEQLSGLAGLTGSWRRPQHIHEDCQGEFSVQMPNVSLELYKYNSKLSLQLTHTSTGAGVELVRTRPPGAFSACGFIWPTFWFWFRAAFVIFSEGQNMLELDSETFNLVALFLWV